MYNRILIISPHTDDGELGCGGSIAKFCDEGKEVFYLALSDCSNAIPKGFDTDSLRKECINATHQLGIKSKNVEIFSFENKKFPQFRHEIFETLERIKNDINPDLTIAPSRYDTHQDHQTTTNEALRVFRRDSSLILYEVPWNTNIIYTTLFIILNENYMNKKISSLNCYKTQLSIDREYFKEENIRAYNKSKGSQIMKNYAEGFEIVRLLI